MEVKKLTKKQELFYTYIKDFIKKHGKSPTTVELRDDLGYKSLYSVTQYLKALEDRHLISRQSNTSRGISLIGLDDYDSPTVIIPVLSSVGCDNVQIIAEHNYTDFVTIDRSFVQNAREDVVAFKAIGDSMIDAGIDSGDYVLTEITDNVSSGDLVVANIGDQAVAKRLQVTENAKILNPESSTGKYEQIIMKESSRIFGKVLEVIKMAPKHNEITYVPIVE